MIIKEAMNTTIATMKHRTPMPAILEHFGLLSIQSEPQYESHQRYEESEERPPYASAVVHRRSGEVLLLNPAVRAYDRLLVYDCAAFPAISHDGRFSMLLIKRCFHASRAAC